jgi:hypothetical protein
MVGFLDVSSDDVTWVIACGLRQDTFRNAFPHEVETTLPKSFEIYRKTLPTIPIGDWQDLILSEEEVHIEVVDPIDDAAVSQHSKSFAIDLRPADADLIVKRACTLQINEMLSCSMR